MFFGTGLQTTDLILFLHVRSPGVVRSHYCEGHLDAVLFVILKEPLFFPGEYRGERRLPRTGKQWEKSITMAKMCQGKKRAPFETRMGSQADCATIKR